MKNLLKPGWTKVHMPAEVNGMGTCAVVYHLLLTSVRFETLCSAEVTVSFMTITCQVSGQTQTTGTSLCERGTAVHCITVFNYFYYALSDSFNVLMFFSVALNLKFK